jgi:aminoglycoside phosphotransferase (APT) family kinase protein
MRTNVLSSPAVSDEDLAQRLAEVVGAADVTGLRRLSGGASRETWSFDAVDPDGSTRGLVLQRQRAGSDRDMGLEARMLRAARASGVPVAEVVADSATARPLGAPFLVLVRVDGETIARRIQRDPEYAEARRLLPSQLGRAAAALHVMPPEAVPGLQWQDQLAVYRDVLELSGQPHPAFELGFRWLEANRRESGRIGIVHGDFRLGNMIVGEDGLRAVIDWEIAHLGDPLEDLGWVCTRAWRFGGPGEVAGLGDATELLDAYEQGCGVRVEPDVLRWWETLGSLRWGIMCIMQASAHFSGLVRSHELAAIGRRVCENEYDLLRLLP